MKHLRLFESYMDDVHLRWATTDELEDFIKRMNDEGLQPEEQNLLDSFSNKVFGAFKGLKMIAGITFREYKKLDDTTMIDIILVDPNYRKDGIGKALVENVIKNAKTRYIITNPYTYEAEAFFKHMGFQIDEDFDPDDTNVMVFEK